MADAALPHFKSTVGEELHTLAARALQLLSMLEVVHMSMAQDAIYVLEMTDALDAFAGRMAEGGRELPLDPNGRSRECLRAVVSKAQVRSDSTLQTAKTSEHNVASVHALIGLSLNRMIAVIQQLLEAVTQHDLFCKPEAAVSPMRASA